jgi:MFS family permease
MPMRLDCLSPTVDSVKVQWVNGLVRIRVKLLLGDGPIEQIGLSWAIPSTIGPWAAGLIMDHYDPRWVWYAAGILCALAIIGFMLLHRHTQARFTQELSDEPQAPVSL